MTLYEQGLDIARELDDVEGESVVLANLGNIYSDMHRLSEALDAYSKSLDLARSLQNYAREAVLLTNLGNCYA